MGEICGVTEINTKDVAKMLKEVDSREGNGREEHKKWF